MPLRPSVLDLREYPLCDRPMLFLLSLEEMAPGETLLVVNDRDPAPLLQELRPVLEKGFAYWIPESGPETWRILISCEESIGDQQNGSLVTIGRTKEESPLRRFITEVRALWGEGKDPNLPFKVKGLLENLLASTSPQEPWIDKLIREGLPTKELYRDKSHGFILRGHVHQKGYRYPPHDHGPCWVLYGVYHGAIEMTTYRRTDNGQVPGRATLGKEEHHRLTPGVVCSYLPGEIHSTLAADHSVLLRFLSRDLNKVPRHRYDLEKGTISVCN